MRRAGASNVEPHHGSFLDLDPHDPAYADVTHVLVDPSCSGSGIVGRRLEDVLGAKDDGPDADNENGGVPGAGAGAAERLARLAEFQYAVVMHALRFPAVQRVCYSTCSVHVEENEAVVERILADAPDFDLVIALPDWTRYGDAADRCSPPPYTHPRPWSGDRGREKGVLRPPAARDLLY